MSFRRPLHDRRLDIRRQAVPACDKLAEGSVLPTQFRQAQAAVFKTDKTFLIAEPMRKVLSVAEQLPVVTCCNQPGSPPQSRPIPDPPPIFDSSGADERSFVFQAR